jgi:osmoprotectant transport system ATP-binding protein
MGTRVAVMQQGGHLAQYAPPTELLLQPANDFVARFVGTDRGLKRLSLLKVSDVGLSATVLARPGDDATTVKERAAAADSKYVLLLDADGRPEGWINAVHLSGGGPVGADQVDPSSPIVGFETTLRDALSMLLASDVQTAVVVDERGRYAGVLTVDALGEAFRTTPEAEKAAVG